MRELWERLRAPLNTWWRRWLLFWTGVLIFTSTLEPLADAIILNGQSVPPDILHIASHLKWVSIAAGFMAALTKKESSRLSDEKLNEQH